MIDVPPVPPVHQEQAIERKLIDCGLDAKGISIKYEADLQSIEIVISSDARASKTHFECINKATAHKIVTFRDDAMQSAYGEYLGDMYRPKMISEATSNIKKLGLLYGFPKRSSYNNLEHYARALEKHCGVIQGSALKVSGERISFDPPRQADYQKFSKLYSNLLAAIMYASATGDFKKFGFIGNEAFAPEGNDAQSH
ncbi:MAG: hypothetical protein ABI673_05415 [Novosphingobium sp.]